MQRERPTDRSLARLAAEPTYPDDDVPEGAVVDGEDLASGRGGSFDVIVIGSGAAGAVAAHVLASAGLDVAIVEEGPWLKTRHVRADVHTTFRRVMRQQGMQVLAGRAFVPMLQGRCVGGSTFVNSAIAWRAPEEVLEDWSSRFGVTIDPRELDPHFEVLERDLSVREVSAAAMGDNNRLFVEAAHRQGLHASPMRRYERGCRGSALCITGCPTAAKQGMSVTYVPWALRLGARIFTSCRVERVELRGARASAVIARSATGHLVTLHARHAVVVAASTVQTPNLLRRSGVRARALGKHFQAHPALAIAGLFDHPIRMGFGATQGAECLDFRKTEHFKLETIALPPDLAAARVPGVGDELADRLARLSHVAMWAGQVRAEAEGTVEEGAGGVDRVRYTMTANDMRATRRSVALIARMMFDVGAREVWPGVHGVPSVLRSADDVRKLDDAPLDPRSYGMIASHLFGAARMGPDPSSSVVGRDFAVHGASGLYVVDSSVFPTNLGVNPQHTIMALSRLASLRIAETALHARAA